MNRGESKQFAILELGRFGGSAPNTLNEMEYEVLTIDQDPQRVQDFGVRVVHHLISPNILDYIELANGYRIVEISAGDFFAGKTLRVGHLGPLRV